MEYRVWMWELDYKESWATKNWRFWTVVLEKTLESPLDCKEIQPVHPKGDQSWIHWKGWCWSSNTLATSCEERTHLKRSWCWERLRARGEVDDRGWDGWMASLTQWTWVWVDSWSWWWTGRPGMLWFMGSDTTEQLDWTENPDVPQRQESKGPDELNIYFLLPQRSVARWNTDHSVQLKFQVNNFFFLFSFSVF